MDGAASRVGAETIAKPGGRAFWWRVHGWAGLKMSVLLTFVLATGTLAVVAHEIDWLATPAMRVAPRAAPVASWGALAASAAAAAPGGRLQELFAPVEPGFAAEAWIALPHKRIERVYLNPWTAQVTGRHGWANAHRLLRDIHRHLMLPLAWGVPIVGSTALFLLASLASGLVTYRKWWRGYARPPRSREPRRFAGELHRWAAVWSLPVLPVVIATGLYYLVQPFGVEAPPLPRPATPVAAPTPPTGAALDAMVARAVAASPGLRVTEVRFPPKAKGYGVQVMGQASAALVRDRANAVWLDPRTGAVRLVARGERLSAFSRWDEAMDPLHFGVWGGWPSKALWFLAGLTLTTLAASGAAVFSLRLHRAEDAPAAGRARSPLGRAWAGMGPWRYVGVALILLACVLAPGVLMEH